MALASLGLIGLGALRRRKSAKLRRASGQSPAIARWRGLFHWRADCQGQATPALCACWSAQ
ncbi:MAG: hypothetical protein MZW92_00405 [Comamonadaceae bacterium]|nr:hypothetical protein [Comamonadaceae bacterium]